MMRLRRKIKYIEIEKEEMKKKINSAKYKEYDKINLDRLNFQLNRAQTTSIHKHKTSQYDESKFKTVDTIDDEG